MERGSFGKGFRDGKEVGYKKANSIEVLGRTSATRVYDSAFMLGCAVGKTARVAETILRRKPQGTQK